MRNQELVESVRALADEYGDGKVLNGYYLTSSIVNGVCDAALGINCTSEQEINARQSVLGIARSRGLA